MKENRSFSNAKINSTEMYVNRSYILNRQVPGRWPEWAIEPQIRSPNPTNGRKPQVRGFLFHHSDHRVHSLSWSVDQGENSVHPVLGELGTRVQIYGINSNRVEFITNYVQAPARQA